MKEENQKVLSSRRESDEISVLSWSLLGIIDTLYFAKF